MTAADGIVAIWYKDYDGQKTLVFHSATPQDVDPRFGGRAQLLGDPRARNCTLLLRGVTPGDSGPYRFRFEIINGDRWSASRDVALSVSGGSNTKIPPKFPPCPFHVLTLRSALHPRGSAASQCHQQGGADRGTKIHPGVLHALRLSRG